MVMRVFLAGASGVIGATADSPVGSGHERNCAARFPSRSRLLLETTNALASIRGD